MPEPCGVTLRNGELEPGALSTPRIWRIVARMEEVGFRALEAGAYRRLGVRYIESGAGDKAGEKDKKDKKDKKVGIGERRKAVKGTAMEVVMAHALTRLDHPEMVQAYWALGPNNEPQRFAPAHSPDLVVPATPGATGLQIVCEVSAGRNMTGDYLRTQLDSALKHCKDARDAATAAAARGEREKISVTYGLLVNPGKIATDTTLQRAYRKFIMDNEDELGEPMGEIRIVALRAADFSLILQRLYNVDGLEFPKALMVRALDEIQVCLREPKVPEGAEWMIQMFIDRVTAQPDLFDQGAAGN